MMSHSGKKNHISLVMPPDPCWLTFLDDALRRYAKTVGFSPKLEQKITGAVLEACEELLRVQTENKVVDPYSVSLDFKGEAAIVEIEYSGRIPLNPYALEDYEVPDATSDVNTISTEALWLHLIKKQMDRAFFRVRGTRRVLCLMQYRREEGAERRMWAMSLRPQLRKEVHLHVDDSGSEFPGATLHKPGTGAFILNPSETFFISRLDGKKSFHDLYMEHVDAIGLVSPNLPGQLYERLQTADMFALTDGELEASHWRQWSRRLLAPALSIPKADETVTAVHRATRWLFTPSGLAILLLAGFSGLIPVWKHHRLFLESLAQLEQRVFESPYLLLPVYLMLIFHVALHELGHGTVCKHFGGKVPRLGIMFYLGSFIFFCDTTAAYSFAEKRKRILVSLGGPIVTFAVLGLGLWGAGVFVGGGSPWETVFLLFSIFNLFGLLMNFNPLIKMDAYYMLVDLTEITDLRRRSFDYVNRRLKAWIGMSSSHEKNVSPREAIIFRWYGSLALVVTVLFAIVPFFWLFRLMKDQSGQGGRVVLAMAGCAILFIRLGTTAFQRFKGLYYREYKLK